MSKRINNHLRNGYSDYNLLFLKKYHTELNLNDEILDIGCGHYRNLHLFYKIGFKNLNGIDKYLPDPNSNRQDVDFSVNFIQEDIVNGLPYQDKSFNIVLCNFVLMFIEPAAIKYVIDEILRVTQEFCIIETQKQFNKSKNSEMKDYDFQYIATYIETNTEFEVIDKKIYKEKLMLRRVHNGKDQFKD